MRRFGWVLAVVALVVLGGAGVQRRLVPLLPLRPAAGPDHPERPVSAVLRRAHRPQDGFCVTSSASRGTGVIVSSRAERVSSHPKGILTKGGRE